MNTTQTTRKAPYTTDQRIEARVCDFATPGMPYVWVGATVVKVESAGKLFDLTVRFDDAALPVQVFRVGPRRGGAEIRPVV